MASKKSERQEIILALITDKSIRNQNELITELSAAGVSMTQSTLSRELKALGIAKIPDGRGGYRYSTGDTSGTGPLSPFISFVQSIERAGNLIVVKTTPGNAQGVAHGLDKLGWDEVMGTIAGDDTILLICRSDERASNLEARLKHLTHH